jgi:hypothetical protein
LLLTAVLTAVGLIEAFWPSTPIADPQCFQGKRGGSRGEIRTRDQRLMSPLLYR